MENKKEISRLKRHKRIKLKMTASSEKPRLVIHRSLKNLCAQIIDDINNKTVLSLSTKDKLIKDTLAYGGNIKAAELFGTVFARQAKEKGITNVVFDRAGYLYHGRIKAFVESARKSGLKL